MAVSRKNTLTGFATEGRSRAEAEEAAITHCLSRGGLSCEIDFAFMNRCAIVVTGNGRTVSVDDLSSAAARKSAFKRCGGGCKVLYEGCAGPAQD